MFSSYFRTDVFQAQSLSVRENLEFYKQKSLSGIEMFNSEKAGRCTSDDDEPHTCNHSHDEDESPTSQVHGSGMWVPF